MTPEENSTQQATDKAVMTDGQTPASDPIESLALPRTETYAMPNKQGHKKALLGVVFIVILLGAAAGYWVYQNH